jgi:hypothetical protein
MLCEPLQADTEGTSLTKASTHVAGVEQHLGCKYGVNCEGSRILVSDFSLGARTKGTNLCEKVDEGLSSGGISESSILGSLSVSVSLYCVCEIHFFFLLFICLFIRESRARCLGDNLKDYSRNVIAVWAL